MINNKKVVIIMPAYNAEKTLKQTYEEIKFYCSNNDSGPYSFPPVMSGR